MKKTFLSILPILALGFFYLASCESESGSQDENEKTSRLEEEHQLEFASYADSVNLGLVEDTFKGSARRETKGVIKGTEVTINYGSPGVRGRVIWNGLVSYDQVWVSGSHWATAVQFSEDVKINDTNVPAGMYAFFSVPGRENWTLILNKEYDQHLADEYDEKLDVARFEVAPIHLEDTVQRLTYEVIDGDTDYQGIIALSWDKIRLELPFSTYP